ncbi:MAG TPA: VIT and VWA domain-containing protein [Blastocatellia bacterium]|nr:VIT and VWA domain-containing protein [Blastocatellia bacterium]
MQRRVLFCLLSSVFCVAGYIALVFVTGNRGSAFVAEGSSRVTQGSLQALNPEKGAVTLCPLKRTDVKAEISGFLARVVVTQEFENPFYDAIEAVYTFPLPQNAAVDDMTMTVGGRTVLGRIKRREEARSVYEAARSAGKLASLLDQERPNIFTQSVANIMPGEKVKITISYVETLKYEDGAYEFVFPMVVGPRYIPGSAAAKQGGGWSADTDRVPDASRITPQVARKGTRAGHDISIEVALDAGVPLDGLQTTLHEVDIERPSDRSAIVRLRNKDEIPNRDFILKYDVTGRKIEDAVLAHHSVRGGFFTMLLQPPERINAEDVTPKELVFVLDTSGSMSGFPIEKAKETMKLALDGLYPQDTFNLITFAGDEHILFPEPVRATRENMAKAQAFLSSRSGGGGTEMMKAIRAALDPSDKQDHLRIACFMTDGYVGNDMEIIAEVQKHQNARVFAFGIGGSVNRFLLDKMVEHGRGEVEYVSLNDDGSAAARRFHERIRNPLLTDISIDWAGLPVADVYPKRIPDLFGAKPVVVSGRYIGGGRTTIKLRGKMSGRDFVRDIPIDLPENEPRHDVLATLWARTRVDDLMSQDFNGIQRGAPRPEVSEAITQLGIEYRLMTQFTSFVAVEELTVNDGGKSRRIEVPVDMPQGVSYDGVFGKKDEMRESVTAVARLGGGGGGQPTGVGASSKPVSQMPSAGPAPAPKVSDRGGSSGGLIGNSRSRTASAAPEPQLSVEDRKRQQMLSRLHPSIAALIERLKAKTEPSSEESRFVRDGKAEVQIWLTAKNTKSIGLLKQLGFEVVLDPPNSKMVIGRIPLRILAELADTTLIRYIAPMTSN